MGLRFRDLLLVFTKKEIRFDLIEIGLKLSFVKLVPPTAFYFKTRCCAVQKISSCRLLLANRLYISGLWPIPFTGGGGGPREYIRPRARSLLNVRSSLRGLRFDTQETKIKFVFIELRLISITRKLQA